MWTQKVVRTVAVSALASLLALTALQGVARANDVPPPATPPPMAPPPPTGPHTVQSCIDTYTKGRDSIFATFRLGVILELANTDTSKAEKLFSILEDLDVATGALDLLDAQTINCAVSATGGPLVRATSMSARPSHGHGGGGATTMAACVDTFNKALKNAARGQSRSLKKKRHPASLSTATATFDSAVKTGRDRLAACLNNATS
jgi:hypothetical protein